MVLVDTSVLIDFLKGKENKSTEKFQNIILQEIPFGITKYTYLELLQGAKNEKEFNLLDEYLSTQTFYHLKNDLKSFASAAKLRLKCNAKGITINSTIDFLIAQIAIENKLFLLHNDKDFDKISKVVKLKIYK